nr:MAG TPA: hypothetical protein [Caudoviricetes sp.]
MQIVRILNTVFIPCVTQLEFLHIEENKSKWIF